MAQPLMYETSVRAPKARPALRLVKTQALHRNDWLAVRQSGIGSSDAAAAVGLNPYRSALELWMDKTGRGGALPQVDPNDEMSPMYWGTLLEPIVAAHYTKRTGRKVRRVNAVLQHPDHPWMLANLDREVLGDPSVQLLECKTTGYNGARLWKDGVPEYVQLQVMHQLAVTGKQAADVAVLICGQELQVHRIERDESMIAQLIALERRFWAFVESDTPPPADGSASADLALRCLYPQDMGTVLDWTQDLEMSSVFSDLLAVRQVLDRHEALEAQLKQRIQQRMGEASRVLFETGEISWKRSKDTHVLDSAKLLKAHPVIWRMHASVKPGSRRFLVQPFEAASNTVEAAADPIAKPTTSTTNPNAGH